MSKQIAILLPHFNNCEGLNLTLNSLLLESEYFTVFVLDDGSIDKFKVDEVVESFKDKLDIIFRKNTYNLGITKTLNTGLELIIKTNNYKYIARLDAGDRCLKNRFKYQKQFLDANPEFGLVSSWVRFVDVNRNKVYDFKPPLDHINLSKIIHIYNPFIHPAVMMRIETIKQFGYYPNEFPALEDHAYFFNFTKYSLTQVIDKFLLEYEINPKGISAKKRNIQTRSRIKLLFHEFKFGLYPIIGIFRAFITYILPQRLLTLFKRKLYK